MMFTKFIVSPCLIILFSVEIFAQSTYTEQDFLFDKSTIVFKQLILNRVEFIHKTVSFCANIDPSSTYFSKEFSTTKVPVFFVTCGKGTSARNVFFSETEIWMKRSDVVARQ